MGRKTLLNVGAFALIAGTGIVASQDDAKAAPTYCVSEAWKYADRETGAPRNTPEWNYYNILFQDLNSCNTPEECNDFDRPCIRP
ncbi:hypothetical protein [Sphingomonas japonica]|uniref:Uncharacterized protein n=1 Tax=Sphingomonas japonica TaxID=511662 RepID=A0ABX0U2Q8_9SPHN|nr:hypothetical protein [Sphingomonas japonica]NIJ23013.1 hypothetical protein [Sphingomonas japonica]